MFHRLAKLFLILLLTLFSAGSGANIRNDSGHIENNFDAEQTQQEMDASVAITAQAGADMTQVIGNYAQGQYNEYSAEAMAARDREQTAMLNGDWLTAQQAHDEYLAAQQNAAQWDEGGTYRVGLHMIAGGLTGGVEGASGAFTSAAVMPELSQHIEQLGLNSTLTNGLNSLTSLGLGAASGGVPGAASAYNVETNNRQLHWATYESMRESCRGSQSQECQVVNRMGGERSQMIDFLALPGQDVVANFGEDGKAVSFTIVDADSHQPLMIMEPTEFSAYSNSPEFNRGWFVMSPQWSLDLGSATAYAAVGNTQRASEHIGYALTDPEYWFTVGLGVTGGLLGRTPVAVIEAESTISYEQMLLNTGARNQAQINAINWNGSVPQSVVNQAEIDQLFLITNAEPTVLAQTFEQSLVNTALRNDVQINATIWDRSVPQSVVNQAEIDWRWVDDLFIANPGTTLPAREIPNFIGVGRQIIITEGDVLYGIRDLGSRNVWWTRTQPLGELQWRMDQAVLPNWNNATHIETMIVPSGHGLIGFEGMARGQSWYLGGGNQIYIPNVPKDWSILEQWR